MTRSTYRIGTRGSKLALVQAGLVRARLEAAYPDDKFETVVISTRGDRETTRPIAAIGDNALFTREIEAALLDGRIDLAVHSMKDLPAECPPGLTFARAWTREDPRDVLVARDGIRSLDDLPPGATVATGSPRRDFLLRQMRPDLNIVGIRGNVDTRLRKLFEPRSDEPRLDAIVLAAAGLKRLGLDSHILQYLSVEQMLPAANQGQLAIELRADDAELKAKVDALGDATADAVACAERAFLQEIGADCHVPVGALSEARDGKVRLRCVFARDTGSAGAFADVEADEPVTAARVAAREVRRQLAGTVTLVGAGPGDPGLITVRGLEAIREADVIVYDRLVSEELLKAAKPGCELIYAGKASGKHALHQWEINALLAKKALAHDRVVRLKGGDPFVFGRGGEEMAYLTERGVRCTVVPGVSSAIAVPASVGIPVTHRGVAQGFEVVTAHAKDDEPVDIDFLRLLDPKRTYVFLMGLGRLAEISASYVAAGKPRETPAAVVSSGTLPEARCVTGTLADIAAKAAAASLASPAVLIVGEVVKLRGRLGFPLAGKRCLVPEIGESRSRLATLLRGLGAEVDVLTVGRIVAIPDVIVPEALEDVTWLALTSRNGLLPFDETLVREVKRRGIRIAVIGRATAAEASDRGLEADFVAAGPTGAAMTEEFARRLGPADVVLHPTAEGVPPALGALVATCVYRPVAVYRNEAVPIEGSVDLGRYDAAFFTCGSSARRVMARAIGKTRCLAIGPATAATLRELGVAEVATAEEPSSESLAAQAVRLAEVVTS